MGKAVGKIILKIIKGLNLSGKAATSPQTAAPDHPSAAVLAAVSLSVSSCSEPLPAPAATPPPGSLPLSPSLLASSLPPSVLSAPPFPPQTTRKDRVK